MVRKSDPPQTQLELNHHRPHRATTGLTPSGAQDYAQPGVMTLRGLGAISVALLAGALLAAAPDPGDDGPTASAARAFGTALLAADASRLRAILPAEGSIRVRLERLGPAEGPYRAAQFEALIRDFLRAGSVHEFELLDVDGASPTYGTARARARLTDRAGRPAEIDLHLAFESAGPRWTLKEVRESPR